MAKPKFRRSEIQNLSACLVWENDNSEAAQFGSLIHFCIELYYKVLREGAVPDVPGLVTRSFKESPGVSVDRKEEALHLMMRFVANHPLSPVFMASEINLEVEEDLAILHGTIDLLESLNHDENGNPTEVLITDWKSGWRESEHFFQQRFYGCLVLANYPTVQQVFFRTDYIRLPEGVVDINTAKNDWEASAYSPDRAWLENWWDFNVRGSLPKIVEAHHLGVEEGSETGGAACQYCKRRGHCAAAVDPARTLGAIEEEGIGRYVMEAHRLSNGRDAIVEALKLALVDREPIVVNGLEAGYFSPTVGVSSGKPRFQIRRHKEFPTPVPTP